VAVTRELSGLHAWVTQRLTALYLLLFIPGALLYLLNAPVHSHAEWQALLGRPAVVTLLALAIAALLFHSWVGGRDVLLDYARPAALRLTLLALLWIWLLVLGLWAARLLLQVLP